MLESAVEKLGILASLTTDIHNDELSSMLGNARMVAAMHKAPVDVKQTAGAQRRPRLSARESAHLWAGQYTIRAKTHTHLNAHADMCVRACARTHARTRARVHTHNMFEIYRRRDFAHYSRTANA